MRPNLSWALHCTVDCGLGFTCAAPCVAGSLLPLLQDHHNDDNAGEHKWGKPTLMGESHTQHTSPMHSPSAAMEFLWVHGSSGRASALLARPLTLLAAGQERKKGAREPLGGEPGSPIRQHSRHLH